MIRQDKKFPDKHYVYLSLEYLVILNPPWTKFQVNLFNFPATTSPATAIRIINAIQVLRATYINQTKIVTIYSPIIPPLHKHLDPQACHPKNLRI